MTDIVERLRLLAAVDNCQASLEAADEIARLRAGIGETLLEREDARAEVERLRAGGCGRDQGTTQYCAEAAKLAAENEKLRAWNAEIALNAREFVAENEKLRAALEDIADGLGETDLVEVGRYAKHIARAALEGK